MSIRAALGWPILVGWVLAGCGARVPAERPGPTGGAPRAAVDRGSVDRPVAPLDSADVVAPAGRVLATALGEATYYWDGLAGRPTASGLAYRPESLVAAHRSYPFGTVVRVTNERNDRTVVVRIVDRGPSADSERARRTIIDVSRRAAEILDFIEDGRVPVTVEVLVWGDGDPEGR